MSLSLKFNEINFILTKVRKILEKKNYYIKHVKKETIINRLLQEILMDLYAIDYTKHSSKDKNLSTKNFKLDFVKNEIYLKKKYLIRQIFKFIFNNFKIFYVLVSKFYKSNFKNKKISIFYNLPFQDYFSGKNFYNFCKNGPIKIIKDDKNITLVNFPTTLKKNNDNFIFSQNIFETISGELSIHSKIKILGKLIFNFIYYFKNLIFNPILSILGKEIIQTDIIRLLNSENNLIDIYFTVSNDQYQEIWFDGLIKQNFTSHMIFYSNNYSSYPRVLKNEKIDGSNIVRVPHLKFIKANKFWVWTEGFSKLLQEVGVNKNNINIVGPILMYLEEETIKLDKSIYNVIIFDSFPFVNTGNFGDINSYNNFNNMKKFVDDIITIIQEIELNLKCRIKVYLKTKKLLNHKDKRNKNRDFRYIKYLNSISDRVEILHKNVNLFSLIRSSSLTITYPFLSPAYIGAYLKQKTLFYDPSSNLKEIYEKNKSIEFISDKETLRNNVFNHFYKLNDINKR